MYPGYNLQQALQDARVREVLANTELDRLPQRRIARFFAALRRKLSLSAQMNTPQEAKQPKNQSPLQRQCQ